MAGTCLRDGAVNSCCPGNHVIQVRDGPTRCAAP